MAVSRMTFLEGDATPEQLLSAVVGNHRQWLLYSARLKGGEGVGGEAARPGSPPRGRRGTGRSCSRG